MKKYIISAAVAAALIVAGGYGVKTSMNPYSNLSDLAKANVEALAKWEEPDDSFNSFPCYTQNESWRVGSNPSCVTCQERPGLPPRDYVSTARCPRQ